jgi:hypothetical protein
MKKYDLSSDVLEQQFGPTELVVLYQDSLTRIICTKALSSGKVLELSWVRFIKSGIELFSNVHKDIVTGQSMGKAFRAHDIEFNRAVNYAWSQKLPDSFPQCFDNNGAVTVLDVSIVVGPANVLYAHILETYSNEVSWPISDAQPSDNQLDVLLSFSDKLKDIDFDPHN